MSLEMNLLVCTTLSFHIVLTIRVAFVSLLPRNCIKRATRRNLSIGSGREQKVDLLNIAKPTVSNQIAWADFEVTRFTAKLGSGYKRLRKLRQERRRILGEFTGDPAQFEALELKKRAIIKRLSIYTRIRKRFQRFFKALVKGTNPIVPYVSPKYQSQNVAPFLYSLAPKKETTVPKGLPMRPRQEQKLEQSDKEGIEQLKEALDALAQSRGQTYKGGKFQPLPPFVTLGPIKKGPRGL